MTTLMMKKKRIIMINNFRRFFAQDYMTIFDQVEDIDFFVKLKERKRRICDQDMMDVLRPEFDMQTRGEAKIEV